MRWAPLAVGLALLLGTGAWARTARQARRAVLVGALGSGDPRRRLAVVVALDKVGLRGCVRHLVERAGQEVDPWVADALAGLVVNQRAELPGTGDAIDLLLWATRRLDGQPGPVPPDAEVDAMVAELTDELVAATRRGQPRMVPGVLGLVGLFLLVQVVASPFKGMGDNGDFIRVMDRIQMGYGGAEALPAAYVQPRSVTGVDSGTAASQKSHGPLVQAAAAADRVAGGRDGPFELRWGS